MSSKQQSTVVGVVVSVSPNSLVVNVTRKEKNYLGKYISRSTKMHAHDAACEANKGDTVSLVPSRPMSKQKTWKLKAIIEKSMINEKELS